MADIKDNNISKGLPNGPYKPDENEKEILDFWLENKFYSPEYTSVRKDSTASRNGRETYTNILPPPNANGNLHLGHMSGYAYQDLMGRYQRMKGKKVLLLPGKDHAGIQTEVVFENKLKEKGKTKEDLGREAFYRACYKFCMDNSDVARSQEKKIGLSADFDRELFTLDPKIVDTILETFIQMYEDGLIYRGKRIINWSPLSQSALADIDTEFKDSITPFVYFKYGFQEPDDFAVQVKNDFTGAETIEVTIERAKGTKWKNKKGEEYEFEYNYYGFVQGYMNPADDSDLDAIILGFEDGKKLNTKLVAKPIGIMMLLGGDHKLIVVNPENKSLDLENELKEQFDYYTKWHAGVHWVLFDEYQDDKYYNNGFILGTVRPETKFGDTAVAVNPKDVRYKGFTGRNYRVRTLNGIRDIKLITDEVVEMEFGTGAVKVTPAHAPEDWDIAQRHPEDCMPEKQVIGFDGKLNHLTGKYEGMSVNEARRAIVPDMKKAGMLVYVDENYKNRIRVCERTGDRIEPLISYQWFVDTAPLKEKARNLVKNGATDILPEGLKNTYYQWMESPEDWCITRQLWWGYRIPVWYKSKPIEYVSETGEVKEKIGEKIIEMPEDYKKLMKVQINNPMGQIILIPGKYGFAKEALYDEILDKYPQANYLGIGDINKPSYEDYKVALDTINFSDDTIVIAHSLGAHAVIQYLKNRKLVIDKLILLAPTTIGADKAEFSKKGFEDFNSDLDIRENIKEIIIIHSDNDEHGSDELFGKVGELVGAHRRVLEKNKKHFAGKEYSYTSEELSKILSSQFSVLNSDQAWIQDPDVLDTWFSSGQWPIATLMAREGDVNEFYPTQVMETGWDILLFWVTRMMLLNPYKATKLAENAYDLSRTSNTADTNNDRITPFENVYLHGLVLDKNGEKMSKSKGNGIDPFEMMQTYGTDALRFSFVVGNSAGQNYRLFEEKIESYRNFCNKIWNASKFVLINLEDYEPVKGNRKSKKNISNPIDRGMLKHLNELIEQTTYRMDNFLFGVAAQELYESFWHKFADEYIEEVKPRLYTKDKEGNPINQSKNAQKSRRQAQKVLHRCLDTYLKLLHPFIPFITERIWMELPKSDEAAKSIMYTEWPK